MAKAYKTGEIPYRYFMEGALPSLYFPKLGKRLINGGAYKSAMFPFNFWLPNFIPPKYFQDFSISELFAKSATVIIKLLNKVITWL